MIVVICSLYHAIFHIQIIFLMLLVSLNELIFFHSHKQKLIPLKVCVTDKLKLLESQKKKTW